MLLADSTLPLSVTPAGPRCGSLCTASSSSPSSPVLWASWLLPPCCLLHQTLDEPHICSCFIPLSWPVKLSRGRPEPPAHTHGPCLLLSNTFPSGLDDSPPHSLPGCLPPFASESPWSFLTFASYTLPSKAQADVIGGQPDVPFVEFVPVLVIVSLDAPSLYACPWPAKSSPGRQSFP